MKAAFDPTVRNEHQAGAIGTDAMADGQHGVAAPLDVRLMIRDTAYHVRTKEGIGDGQVENDRPTLVEFGDHVHFRC